MTEGAPGLEFPIAFSLRVMGRNTPEFPPLVLSLVRIHVPDLQEETLVKRFSRDERYMSLLIPVVVVTRTQFEAIYQELAANEHVLMVI